jgi:hypothetical protein
MEENYVIQMKKKVKVLWPDKEDFLCSIRAGEWAVTEDDELVPIDPYSDDEDLRIKKSFLVHGGATLQTTHLLRLFCEEFHPEIDFDTEFDTSNPGVFARYQERFGHDYEEWMQQTIYDAMKEELGKIGYVLPWE